MADEPTTAGTPEPGQEGGQSAGTPPQQPSDDGKTGGGEPNPTQQELEALRQFKEQALREKSNTEAMRREAEEIIARSRQQQPTDHGADREYGIRVQGAYATVQRAMQDPKYAEDNPYEVIQAQNLLMAELIRDRNMTQQQIRDQFGMMEVPGDRRSEVQRIMAEARARGEHITAQTANNMYDYQKLKEREGALAKREAELAKIEEARRAGVVDTRTVPAAPAAGTPAKMTYKQFRERMSNADPAQRAELARKANAGELDLVPG